MTKSKAELLDEAQEFAAHFRSGLPDGFDIAMLTLESKLPFKALSYREALIHRFSDLASGAAESASVGRVVSAATLTRGGFETMARIWELSDKVKLFLQTPNVEELDQFLMSRLFGSRNNPDLYDAANILGAIDKVSKKIPHFIDNYDILSEFVHPNYSGTLGAFAKIDQLKFKVELADTARSELALTMILNLLLGTMHGFHAVYNALGDLVGDLNSHFETG